MRPDLSQWPAPVYSLRVRVYFEDTDAGGIVYHANYLRFMERARTDWLRAKGVAHTALDAAEQIVLVVRDAQLEFLRPARLDDELQVDVRVLAVRRASIALAQVVTRIANANDIKSSRTVARNASIPATELLATGTVRVAALTRKDGRVAALPDWLLEKIER